jgi:prepilin-type N-terminal cleavage/methylation domain-containing protein
MDRLTSRRGRRGLTLIELLVGMAIGLFVVAAAVTFTSQQTRWLGFTASRIDVDQSGRVALEILAEDLRHAGLGVGYDSSDEFAGLRLGNFSVPGGATFDSTDRQLVLRTETTITDDVGILLADEGIATIAEFSGASGQICNVPAFEVGDIVTMVSEDSLSTRTARLTGLNDEVCIYAACASGCRSFAFAADSTYLSDASADDVSYAGGEMFRGFKVLVWYVRSDGRTTELRRAILNQDTQCTDPAAGCGGTVTNDVETLQMRVWQWDEVGSAWIDRTDAASLVGRDRVRVDLELVVRTRQDQQGPQNPILSSLSDGLCLPGPCGTQDTVPRRAFRTSVELRNAGRTGVK